MANEFGATLPEGWTMATPQDAERRLQRMGLTPDDLARIATVRDLIVNNSQAFCDSFFSYLSGIGEAAGLFANPRLLDEAKRLKFEHLAALAKGNYGAAYVEQRLRLGLIYGRTGLGVPAFLGAFHHLLARIGNEIVGQGTGNPEAAFQTYLSLSKIAFFDIGIISDAIVGERERTIRAQQDAIRELSTPVLQLRDRLLILPIIGVIDTMRAKQLTDGLLHAIRANRARVVVMDITGVAAVDSKVANHLIQTVAAAKLMGARVIVTGLSADVAQALVALGVDLGMLDTVGDLQGGMEQAEKLLGLKVSPIIDSPRPSPSV